MAKPCRYQNQPGGCRRRDCTFSHSTPGTSTDQRPRSYSSTSNRASSPAPLGVCKFYWSTGTCGREHTCRFNHVKESDSDSSNERHRRSSSPLTVNAILPFLTDEGLARVTGSGTDSLSPQLANALSPNQAQYRLKRFLTDDFRFGTVFDIYAFFVPLSNAISTNPAWTLEDGQIILASVAQANGLNRIADVLRRSPVSTTAGSDTQVLSFQRAWLPLLRFLSSDTVVKSTLHQFVNALFSIIMNEIEVFSNTLVTCMDEMIGRQSFTDYLNPSTRGLLGSQVLASIAGVMFECTTRFKNAISTHPQITHTIKKLQSWLDAWVRATKEDPPKFDNVFGNNFIARNHIIEHISKKVQLVVDIVDREQSRMERQQARSIQLNQISGPSSGSQEGLAAMLHTTFDGPGDLSLDGSRHDNDAIEIREIRIAPTHEELICRKQPFLPANFFEAPHHLLPDSMERLLDIQFRLLREELIAPLRSSINLVRNDLLNKSSNTKLATLLAKKGGKYRGSGDTDDSVMFNVYTGIKFHSMTPDNRGLSVNISFDTPPGRARQGNGHARATFWRNMSGKRIMQGGLIALVWSRNNGRNVDVHLGTIASSLNELTESVERSADRVSTRVIFFDSEVELRILNVLKFPQSAQGNNILLVESPMMYEAIRPFLEALTMEPGMIPFQDYLVHRPSGFFRTHTVKPPRYACLPRFKYRLNCLFNPGAREGGAELIMVPSDPQSVENARNELKRGSRLDPSQADAVVDALTREVALIQGPPGTGKSYTGVELLRVLVGHARPVLMIAFTNHALDHLLSSVLDAGITKRIVRLGSRSADERISEYSIENLEFAADKSRLSRTFGACYRELKSIQEEVNSLMKRFSQKNILSSDITAFIETQYPEHYEHIVNPPSWINTLMSFWGNSEDRNGWNIAGKHGKRTHPDFSTYSRWLRGEDLEFLGNRPDLAAVQPSPEEDSNTATELSNKFATLTIDTVEDDSSDPESDADDEESQTNSEDQADWQRLEFIQTEGLPVRPPSQKSHSSIEYVTPEGTGTPNEARSTNSSPEPGAEELNLSDLRDPLAFFVAHSLQSIPEIPVTDRSLDVLLALGEMWTLSLRERRNLDQFWRDRTREDLYQGQLADFQNLRKTLEQRLELFNQEKNEMRRGLLHNIDIVGCTTTGAAKFTSLLRGVAPKVVLVEEAGQVMEAHILGNLVPSIEHLIMIGDPLQLRPTLNNFKLSVDSKRGSQLYKFDMSLMERLSKEGFPMSRIDVQRRMRPEVAQLIRNALYPGLEDHELVKQYPDVRGFSRNVFFLSHEHSENDGNEEDGSSKFNTYEVQMIKDIVLYLLRQGCYTQDGDIVVLCAYLGQLARVRDALSQHVPVVLDERDQEALADQEAEKDMEESRVEYVQVSKRVRLRTVDNYQGEEAKIVILSLVRNVGRLDNDEEMRSGGTIGFLKSENRTNVALSRAKHGLYILGNAAQLASKSRMWRIVLDELRHQGNIGEALPAACYRHPENVNYISRPGQLSHFAPDGGCLLSCDYRLKCGHVCPHKCHPDDIHHVAIVCSQPCRKLCVRGHPCFKQCSSDCGQCMYSIPHVELPCGHIADSVPCYAMEILDAVRCDVIVTRQLPRCEHTAELACSTNVTEHNCTQRCNGILECCGRNCSAQCHNCQVKNPMDGAEQIKRTLHWGHPCKKTLYCGHECALSCSQGHQCTTMCREACRQWCAHSSCPSNCSTPCEPCKEVCTWTCPHYACPVPCGSVCTRLPCNKRCEKRLSCGHRCPSVCGEDCRTQICPECAPPELKETVVDLILYLKLGDILVDEDEGAFDNMLITLPSCRHIFTVETLDGHCGIEEYYTKNQDGNWSGLTSPQHTGERRKPPMCPTCRTAITSPRYSRVFKSANLDILERNVISHMSSRMNAARSSLDQIVKADIERALTLQAKQVEPSPIARREKQKKARKRGRKAVLDRKELRPVSVDYILPDSKLFSVSPHVTQIWKGTIRDLTKVYKAAADICDIRSAHVNTWEAAFSFLYQQEMDKAVADPTHGPRRPEEYAMRLARMNVGIPQPRADKRFLVEAIWVTLQIRFTLVDLARTWIKAVGSSAHYELPERVEWGNYGLFLLESCERDVQIVCETAEASDSRRQMTKSRLFYLRLQLEKCRFNIEISRQCGLVEREKREKYAEQAIEGAEAAKKVIVETRFKHLMALPNDSSGWIQENFLTVAETIQEEWLRLERSLTLDTFYEPLSLDEKMAIVKALDFSHTGHFYTCRNGHAFVITECGGAMQAARCPECGQPIGGQDHQLDASNSRAEEYEELARRAGSVSSPWPWAR
ncbi:hypothetical protein AX15_003447 [Amanita polypyramis BW_CC]|nr:hypothetical protein AX15_003447 [Amanita polypyramis BW_CC]